MKTFVTGATVAAVLLGFVTAAVAQPSLSSLWPVDVGREWEFDGRVESPVVGVQTGTVTYRVLSQTALPSGAALACFDVQSTVLPAALPGSVETLSARPVYVSPTLLLLVPGCDGASWVRIDNEVALGTWSDSGGDWSWWWMTADVTPGSTFRLPIRTEFKDDAFVNGEVRTIEGTVTTPAGTFTNAVIVDYLVEWGESELVAGGGEVLGTVTSETTGWVAFVPDVGPVATEETTEPVEIDCPECPPIAFDTIVRTMELRARTSVPTAQKSFGSLKARY